MKIRHLFLAASAMAFATSASAETNYLHVVTTNGWEILNLDTVDRLTFEGNVMNALDKNRKVVNSFNRADLETCFVSQNSGVDEITESGHSSESFSIAARTLTALVSGNFAIYSTAGERLAAIEGVQSGQEIGLSALPAGIYVITLGDHSAKVALN